MIYLSDPDVTIHCGDALEVLAGLPDGSVDCCVTSPPYWGLRDYGTGEWEGGEEGCEHIARPTGGGAGRSTLVGTHDRAGFSADGQYRDLCGKCGARRVDRQLGLEATPEEYVARMVEVFREVRRVLAGHGTCWLNLGDSYASHPAGNTKPRAEQGQGWGKMHPYADRQADERRMVFAKERVDDLKPKDLCMIPARIAMALQADGWWLRSDIIWSKPNPMPESVTDRPTKSHEYVFLLTKQARYFYDADAVREPAEYGYSPTTKGQFPASVGGRHGSHTVVRGDGGSRNLRSVWEIPTQPYPEAHFATFPEALVERCLKAGCPSQVCRVCGKPRERIVERGALIATEAARIAEWDRGKSYNATGDAGKAKRLQEGGFKPNHVREATTVGFSDCGHNAYRPGIILDPFLGSGTTAYVARKHGRRCIGIELSPDYCALAARRLAQQSLLALPA